MKSMICLFRLPKEADTLQSPIYHCPRCVFHQPIYLSVSCDSFRWIGEVDAEFNEEFDADVGEGGILWGAPSQNPATSETFIGGTPKWVQSDDGPLECPTCNKDMEFLLQLDSTELGDLNLNFYFYGVMYAYRCCECHVFGYLMQTS